MDRVVQAIEDPIIDGRLPMGAGCQPRVSLPKAWASAARCSARKVILNQAAEQPSALPR